MLPGRQKTVITPGQNKKRYIAGALDAATGAIHYLTGERKKGDVFVALPRQLAGAAYKQFDWECFGTSYVPTESRKGGEHLGKMVLSS